MLRSEPLAYLPALIALALAGSSLPAQAQARLVMLCSGDARPAPGQSPDGDCSTACHIGTARTRKPSGRL